MMVTDWYRALAFQKCNRSRLLGWEGAGVERRALPIGIVNSRAVRKGIHEILAGQGQESAAVVAADYVLDVAQKRTIILDESDYQRYGQYNAVLDEAEKVKRLVRSYEPRWNRSFKMLELAPAHLVSLAGAALFVSRPAAMLEDAEGRLWVYHIKVNREWRDSRQQATGRSFQIRSEMAVATQVDDYADRMGGVLVDVQVVGSKKVTAGPIFEVPFDDNDVSAWLTQTAVQEQKIKATDPKLRILFPQYTHSCEMPFKCEFHDICWAPGRDVDPLNDPRYMPRELDELEAQDAEQHGSVSEAQVQ